MQANHGRAIDHHSLQVVRQQAIKAVRQGQAAPRTLLPSAVLAHGFPPRTHPAGEKTKELFCNFNSYKSTRYANSACPRSRIQEREKKDQFFINEKRQ